MNGTTKIAASVLATGLMLGGGAANALDIDQFDGTGPITVVAPYDAAAGTSSSGYNRNLQVVTDGADTGVQIDTATNPGVYAHSQDAGILGSSTLTYDLGGIDLTADTSNAFRLELINVDLNGLIGITVDGITSALSTTSIILDNGGALPSFADFLFTDFAGVDFTAVSSVALSIDGTNQAALDAVIDSLTTVCSSMPDSGGSGTDPDGNLCGTPPDVVPAPGVIALMGLGLVGLGAARRRKA